MVVVGGCGVSLGQLLVNSQPGHGLPDNSSCDLCSPWGGTWLFLALCEGDSWVVQVGSGEVGGDSALGR